MWYEWYAESYLPVANASLPLEHGQETSASHGPSFSSKSTHVAVPSPALGAADVFPLVESGGEHHQGRIGIKAPSDVVKIGQTTLHNPGGRSSWIGLT